MKVLLTERYSEEQINKIENLGYKVIYKRGKNLKLDETIEDIDILVCYNPFNLIDISKLHKLKFIQLTSVGIDQVPKDIIVNKNITLCNNKGAYSIPMAEYIVMYILNIYKNTNNIYKNKDDKVWHTDYSLEELTNKKIGFLGTGTIAQNAAKRLRGFDVQIYGVNTNGRSIDLFDKCFSIDNMDLIFKECDVVVSTIPSTKDTVGIIDNNKFEIMKKDSIFINVGRGNIVKEKDLVKHIDKFKGVALDVFETEPLPIESELWNFDNVIITSHNSWISNNNNERTFDVIYKNLSRYKDNKQLNNIVDIKKGY